MQAERKSENKTSFKKCGSISKVNLIVNGTPEKKGYKTNISSDDEQEFSNPHIQTQKHKDSLPPSSKTLEHILCKGQKTKDKENLERNLGGSGKKSSHPGRNKNAHSVDYLVRNYTNKKS